MGKRIPGNEVELVFKILEKEHLTKRHEIPGDLGDIVYIISLLEKYSPIATAQLIADEIRIR